MQYDYRVEECGYTVPYVAEDRFQLNHNPKFKLNSKIDVYSLGVTLFKVLFGRHIWGDIGNKHKFLSALHENELKIMLAPERLLLYGVPEVIEALAHLSLRCVNR